MHREIRAASGGSENEVLMALSMARKKDLLRTLQSLQQC